MLIHYSPLLVSLFALQPNLPCATVSHITTLDASLARSVHTSERSRNQTENALQNEKDRQTCKLSVKGKCTDGNKQTRSYEKGQEETDSQSRATGHDV